MTWYINKRSKRKKKRSNEAKNHKCYGGFFFQIYFFAISALTEKTITSNNATRWLNAPVEIRNVSRKWIRLKARYKKKVLYRSRKNQSISNRFVRVHAIRLSANNKGHETISTVFDMITWRTAHSLAVDRRVDLMSGTPFTNVGSLQKCIKSVVQIIIDMNFISKAVSFSLSRNCSERNEKMVDALAVCVYPAIKSWLDEYKKKKHN